MSETIPYLQFLSARQQIPFLHSASVDPLQKSLHLPPLGAGGSPPEAARATFKQSGGVALARPGAEALGRPGDASLSSTTTRACSAATRTGAHAGYWGCTRLPQLCNLLRFEAPCVLTNTLEYADKDGKDQCFSAHFLCRPVGQGKSMLIMRFGSTVRSPIAKLLLPRYLHENVFKVFE